MFEDLLKYSRRYCREGTGFSAFLCLSRVGREGTYIIFFECLVANVEFLISFFMMKNAVMDMNKFN